MVADADYSIKELSNEDFEALKTIFDNYDKERVYDWKACYVDNNVDNNYKTKSPLAIGKGMIVNCDNVDDNWQDLEGMKVGKVSKVLL